MPGYVPKALLTLRHPSPAKSQHSPHRWTAPVYGQRVQLANSDLSPLLDKLGIKRVQQISGLFLYYSRCCDPTIIVALNEISNHQASPTAKTKQACDMLLDYLSTHPDATIRYYASDMILAVCSDAAYLVLPNARSRAAGHFFLTTLPSATSSPPNPKSNGAVHVLCKTIRTVAASASEAETGSLFLNAQEAVPMITALEEMGHKQPSTGTPIETDNSTAHGILHAQVRLKKSKAFDMRYHWLRDHISQKQFNLYWAPGKSNSADYFSKHHPPAHHKLMRYQYLHRALAAQAAPPPVRGTHPYTWDELKDIDERRRAILRRCEYGLWRTLSNIDGSVLGFLMRDSLFWITILIFIIVRIQVRVFQQQIPVFVEALDDGNLVIIGGFISLFMTMYVEGTFRRYGDQHQLSSICMGRIMDVASLANIYLPKQSAERIVRYLNAAHVSGYIGLSDTYLRDNFFAKIDEDYGLLTECELSRIES
ncbi:Reverse transcriptase (RNA-dependent DNA polymerase) [Fragilaria crotonensis]|nr:Reverse transcriptase (RNA-dependent DNA polymerase) [Fragilaria crotonensis]